MTESRNVPAAASTSGVRVVVFVVNAQTKNRNWPYSEMIAAFHSKAAADMRVRHEQQTGKWSAVWVEETYLDG